MFLHLGNNYLVNTKDVIGIFDIENTSVSANTKEFLNFAAKNRRVVNCTYEMPKSFVVCLDKDFTETVYISQKNKTKLLKKNNRMPE